MVVTSPIPRSIEIAHAGMMDRMRTAPEVVRGQGHDADDAADPVVRRRAAGRRTPWLQSCWIMNSRTRNPAAGTASGRQSQG